MSQTQHKNSPLKDARVEVVGLAASFGLLAWAVIGEYIVGVYGGTQFLPLFFIPFVHVLRCIDLDMTSFPYAPKKSSLFFDRVYPIFVLFITFASIPYLLAVSSILTQDTILSTVFTGHLGHTGIHHGWAGWYLFTEGYLYHRLNRHAAKRRHLGEAWRNGLSILGLFLFLDDFWGEQISAGVLGWPDWTAVLNQMFPFSWDVNFAIEIAVVILISMIISFLYFHFKHKDVS